MQLVLKFFQMRLSQVEFYPCLVSIGESLSICPFLKNNADEAPKGRSLSIPVN